MVVSWGHILWVVVMGIGMLGLIYCGIRARTVAPEVLGSDITLAASIFRTGPWFLVAVAWSHSVCLVVVYVSVLGYMLVWVGWLRNGGH